jgi:hypothetical protein
VYVIGTKCMTFLMYGHIMKMKYHELELFVNGNKNHDYICKEIKTRLNSGNICYTSIHNLPISSLIIKNLRSEIIMLPSLLE